MIYLIDSIGNESGQPLYDEMFMKYLGEVGVKVKTISNYEGRDRIRIIKNFYHSGRIGNIVLLLCSYFRVLFFYLTHPNNVFVYQSWGMRFIDILFVSIFTFSKSSFVLVHDAFEITKGRTEPTGMKYKIQKFVYNHMVRNMICHSDICKNSVMNHTGYKNEILIYPHFPYRFDKNYNLSDIPAEVQNLIAPDKYNFLFFGQLRSSKGVDVLIEAMNILRDEKQINIIIAGSDKEGLMNGIDIPENTRTLIRFITDEEEKYLFCRCNAVLIPYKDVYQSGVLESVLNFEKLAIISDVEAFQVFHNMFPSFGVMYSPNTGKALASCMMEQLNKTFKYEQADIDKYNEYHNPSKLKKMMLNRLDLYHVSNRL